MIDIHQILIIENSSDDYLYLERILSKTQDCKPCRAKTMAIALNEIEKQSIDLILLDLTLPDSKGLDSITLLASVTDTPIVVLTGLDNEQMALKAVQRGAQDYLVKGSSIPCCY